MSEFGPGYIHFPRDVDDEWFKQLTAEKLMTKHVKGIPTRVWKQIRARNEALDCAVYAFAAYASLNANLERIAQRMEAQVKTPEPSPAQPEQQTITPPYPHAAPRRSGGGFVEQVALMPGIPETIYAGDSLSWTESAGEYPLRRGRCTTPSGGRRSWTLLPRPAGRTTSSPCDRRADGDSSAGLYTPGSPSSRTGRRKRYTISTGTHLPSGRTSRYRIRGFDGRSHAQKVLDAIEATMEGRATKSQAIMQINNRQIQYLKPEELIKWRSFYKAEVAREKTAEKVAQGEDPGNRILTRFRDDASRGAWPLNRVWRWPW